MAFGFPAFHTEHLSVAQNGSTDLYAAVLTALNALSWPIREQTADQITASTSVNVLSWGEKVLITFVPDSGIAITSTCALPTQCFDWGKNKANVRKFIAEIRKQA